LTGWNNGRSALLKLSKYLEFWFVFTYSKSTSMTWSWCKALSSTEKILATPFQVPALAALQYK